MRTSTLALALSLSGAISLSPAVALADQPSCAPHETVIALLAREYRELPVAQAMSSLGVLIEITATADGSTWTMLATAPHGSTCYVASGTMWMPRHDGTMAVPEPGGKVQRVPLDPKGPQL